MKKIFILALLLVLTIVYTQEVSAEEWGPVQPPYFDSSAESGYDIIDSCDYQFYGWLNQFAVRCKLDYATLTYLLDDGVYLKIPESNHLALEANGLKANVTINEYFDKPINNFFYDTYQPWTKITWDDIASQEQINSVYIIIPFVGSSSDRTLNFLETMKTQIKYMPITPLENQVPEVPNEYTRYEKKEGIWYGILEFEVTDVVNIHCDRANNCESTYFRVSISRNLERLYEVKYRYTTYESCNFNLFGLACMGSKPATTKEAVAYDRNVNGLWNYYLTTSNRIFRTGDTYTIYTPSYIKIQEIDVLEFSLILTMAEVDAVMADIQVQYDNEVLAILTNPTTTLEEKQHLLNLLNLEYQEFTIEYGEVITMLCENESLCSYRLPDEDSMPPEITWNAITKLVKTWTVIAIVVAVGLIVGLGVFTDLLQLLIQKILLASRGIAHIIYVYIWTPIFAGIRSFVTFIFDSIFWFVK